MVIITAFVGCGENKSVDEQFKVDLMNNLISMSLLSGERKPDYSLKADIGKILRKLCEQKGVEIIEAELCSDHIHMLVAIPPSMSVSAFVGYLKGKSALMIFDRHTNLKYKYGNRHFWCRDYYVDTVGKNKNAIVGGYCR